MPFKYSIVSIELQGLHENACAIEIALVKYCTNLSA